MTAKTTWETFFDAHAPLYEENVFTENTPKEVDFVLDELGLATGSSVLDVGCGTGRHSIELARRGYAVTGLDLSSEMLARAAAAKTAAVDVQWIRSDATSFSLPSTYDAAICLCEGSFGLLSETDDPIAQPLSILCNEGSACRSAFLGGYSFSRDGIKLLDAASQYYFYATGVTPAMEAKMVGSGSQYALAFVDSKGQSMKGSRTYRLHIPANVPVNNFWSVIAYDNQTRSFLQTDQIWPSVTSKDKNFRANDNGSADVYFGPKRPGNTKNFIQTIPHKGWNAIFRLYGPLKPWFDKTWRLGEIELVSDRSAS